MDQTNGVLVEVRDLVKTYRVGSGTVRALDGVSLAVRRGEFVSIMGPSGSGKSTLLHLIGALERPDSGDVLVEGVPLSGLSDNELSDHRRERIGFVFQQFNLLPTMSALENAELPLLLDGRVTTQHEDRIRGLLEAVGMGERLDHRPEELSGGEMQRVAIARALANEPAVLLADEPTGNLDSETGERILALLKRRQTDDGQTIIMVTHDARAAAYGDRILTVKDGRVTEEIDALAGAR